MGLWAKAAALGRVGGKDVGTRQKMEGPLYLEGPFWTATSYRRCMKAEHEEHNDGFLHMIKETKVATYPSGHS